MPTKSLKSSSAKSPYAKPIVDYCVSLRDFWIHRVFHESAMSDAF